MLNRLPFILLASLPLIFFIFLIDSFYSTKALAVTSNCIITKVGAPVGNPPLPAACNSGGATAVVALAKAHLTTGTYVWGAPPQRGRPERTDDPNTGNAPTTFDCSGFAYWAWYWGTGGKVKLGSNTGAVWNATGDWKKVVTTTYEQLQPGDLVYFYTPVSHVGIYEGPGTCGAKGAGHCYLEYYDSGLPGRENKLEGTQYVGFVRPNYGSDPGSTNTDIQKLP